MYAEREPDGASYNTVPTVQLAGTALGYVEEQSAAAANTTLAIAAPMLAAVLAET